MASLFGDDGVDDLFNDNLPMDQDQLPSDGEGEKLFADDEENNENAGEPGGEEGGEKLQPKKRAVRNPRPRLTVDTLRGPRGIQTIEEYFKDIKFRGRGNEKTDLDEVLRRLQHWGHRMYPTYTFDDVLNNIERLGKKKPLQVHMTRYRLGHLEEMRAHEAEAMEEAQDDQHGDGGSGGDEPFDEFDALLGEQIAMSKLAPPRTPHQRATMSTTSSGSNSTLVTPSFSRGNAVMSTPYSAPTFDRNGAPLAAAGRLASLDISDYGQPLPPSQPATPSAKKLSTEQMARIAENRRLAQERLKAKQEQQQQPETASLKVERELERA